MSSKERREIGVWDVPKESCKFAAFEPLHKLWKGYMGELLDSMSPSHDVLRKLLKADYHGAHFTVVKAKCPSFIGLSGIVIKETELMFYLVTRKNQMKMIIKKNAVFTFETNGQLFTLFGNQFQTRAGERVAKKYKDKATVDL
ncbi:RNase P/RNase MRP complex subunit [Thoreauomyces humboldtii]|nr:RNase P/RNase MRP complex subunit [Thoreauomyces humboldtii]